MVTIDKYGTIIEGTLKSSDIAEACLDWLKENASRAYLQIKLDYLDIYDLSEVDVNFWNTNEGYFLLEAVYQAMEEQVPDGHYFGAHPGDGSDIGFHLEEKA